MKIKKNVTNASFLKDYSYNKIEQVSSISFGQWQTTNVKIVHIPYSPITNDINYLIIRDNIVSRYVQILTDGEINDKLWSIIKWDDIFVPIPYT